jgi:hypothetical protein
MEKSDRPKLQGVIYQYDKRSGITYAYENHPYIEKGTGKHKSKRKLIGRLDTDTNQIVATDGRRKNKKQRDAAEKTAAEKVRDTSPQDYKTLYETLLAKWTNLESRVSALESSVKDLKKNS